MLPSHLDNTGDIRTLYDLATLYDEQHSTFSEDFSMYQELARQYGGPVLELGIGNGRVACELAADGFDVWGIDLSKGMLSLLDRKMRQKKLAMHLFEADMIDFDLSAELAQHNHTGFGLVTVPFNSLCHLHTSEELLLCLGRVRRHMAPGGVFAPSIFVPHPAFLHRTPGALHYVDRFFSDSRNEEMEVYESNHYDGISQLNHVTWFFVGQKTDETLERRFILRMYYPQEIRHLLRQAGFKIVEEWGDYTKRLRTPADFLRGLPPETLVQTLVCS